MASDRDLVAEARALATPPRSSRGNASPLAERGQMIHRLADKLDEIRDLATKWAEQTPDDPDAEQQIDDGCALLLLIDGRTLPEAP